MARIDITEEEAVMIAQSIGSAARHGELDDEYTAFNLLQVFKREFPEVDYFFDVLDYGFLEGLQEYE